MSWQVPNIWKNGECWIIGGGLSLTTQFNIPRRIVELVKSGKKQISAYSPYLKQIHDKHVIGINGAFRLGDWVDICFFGDKEWYFENAFDLKSYKGLMVGCANSFALTGWQREGIHHVQQDDLKPYGIHPQADKVCWNYNSGAASISLAYSLGCKRIILVGFDMQLTDGEGHWHNLYNNKTDMPFHKHLIGFDQIASDAKKLGITIINASPDSAITQFQKIPVKQLL